MKRLIEQVDRILAMLEVKGDSVMLLADARRALGQLYQMAPEEKAPEDEGSETP
jgi:hypothetical protein